MKQYKLKCSSCKKETIHSIYSMSRRKGIKVRCDICLTSKPWKNLRDLEQLTLERETIKLQEEKTNGKIM